MPSSPLTSAMVRCNDINELLFLGFALMLVHSGTFLLHLGMREIFDVRTRRITMEEIWQFYENAGHNKKQTVVNRYFVILFGSTLRCRCHSILQFDEINSLHHTNTKKGLLTL